jgi:hypothetical protein
MITYIGSANSLSTEWGIQSDGVWSILQLLHHCFWIRVIRPVSSQVLLNLLISAILFLWQFHNFQIHWNTLGLLLLRCTVLCLGFFHGIYSCNWGRVRDDRLQNWYLARLSLICFIVTFIHCILRFNLSRLAFYLALLGLFRLFLGCFAFLFRGCFLLDANVYFDFFFGLWYLNNGILIFCLLCPFGIRIVSFLVFILYLQRLALATFVRFSISWRISIVLRSVLRSVFALSVLIFRCYLNYSYLVQELNIYMWGLRLILSFL